MARILGNKTLTIHQSKQNKMAYRHINIDGCVGGRLLPTSLIQGSRSFNRSSRGRGANLNILKDYFLTFQARIPSRVTSEMLYNMFLLVTKIDTSLFKVKRSHFGTVYLHFHSGGIVRISNHVCYQYGEDITHNWCIEGYGCGMFRHFCKEVTKRYTNS